MEFNDLRSHQNRHSEILASPNGFLNTGSSMTTTTSNFMNTNHTLEKIITYDDKVEMVFRETSNIVYTNGSVINDKVYKIIITSKDNKLVYSNKIYGNIVPASEEYFTFDD